jgi:membrane protein
MRELGRRPWVRFARRLTERVRSTRLQLLAAALAYYAAFSLGPLLLLLAGWLALLLRSRPELAAPYRQALVDLLGQVLPLQADTAGLVTQSFDTVVNELNRGALLRSVISLLVLVWASGNFFTSLQLALEVVFDVREGRAFWRKRLVAVLLVLSVAVVIAVEVVGGALLSALNEMSQVVLDWLAQGSAPLPLLPLRLEPGAGLQVARMVVAATAFTLTFRYLPRRSSTWLGAVIGAVVSTGGILAVRWGLLLTFSPERFNLIYGVITSLLALLLWLYLALLLFLVGASVAAEVSALRTAPPDVGDNPA